MSLLEQPIGQLACALPGATRIFHHHKLDFCCGGHKSLREAAEKRGLNPEALLSELEPLQNADPRNRDWRLASARELIDYILRRFHEQHRQDMPELIRLARRVEQVHGERESPEVLVTNTSGDGEHSMGGGVLRGGIPARLRGWSSVVVVGWSFA